MVTTDDVVVVDADAHYTDHFEDVIEYMDDDDPWIEKFETGLKNERSDHIISLWPKLSGGRRGGAKREERERIYQEDDDIHGETTEDVIRIMAHLGVEKILLLSNQMLMFGTMSQGDKRQTKFANAYVDYMLDRIVAPDEGIYIAVPAPLDYPDRAAELIERVADEEAVVAVALVTAKTEPPLGHRRYEPIYDAAQSAGLPVLFHGASALMDDFYLDGFGSVMETHVLGFIWDNMSSMASILGQGIPEQFPDLEFVFQEAGLFWVPMMMYRMDMEYLRREWDAPLLEKRPSEYMKEMYFCTQPMEIVPDRSYFESVIEMLGGPDRLMYASDYPHPDYDDPSAIGNLPFLTDEEKARILGGTAMEVFGI